MPYSDELNALYFRLLSTGSTNDKSGYNHVVANFIDQLDKFEMRSYHHALYLIYLFRRLLHVRVSTRLDAVRFGDNNMRKLRLINKAIAYKGGEAVYEDTAQSATRFGSKVDQFIECKAFSLIYMNLEFSRCTPSTPNEVLIIQRRLRELGTKFAKYDFDIDMDLERELHDILTFFSHKVSTQVAAQERKTGMAGIVTNFQRGYELAQKFYYGVRHYLTLHRQEELKHQVDLVPFFDNNFDNFERYDGQSQDLTYYPQPGFHIKEIARLGDFTPAPGVTTPEQLKRMQAWTFAVIRDVRILQSYYIRGKDGDGPCPEIRDNRVSFAPDTNFEPAKQPSDGSRSSKSGRGRRGQHPSRSSQDSSMADQEESKEGAKSAPRKKFPKDGQQARRLRRRSGTRRSASVSSKSVSSASSQQSSISSQNS